MAITKPEKEIPYCTIFLVFGALACHTLVLSGNLATSAAFTDLGKSTAGWSHIGMGMAHSMTHELDVIMTNVTTILTKAIAQVGAVQKVIDLSLGVTGKVADDAAEETANLLQTGDWSGLNRIAEDPTPEETLMKPAYPEFSSFAVMHDTMYDPVDMKNASKDIVAKVKEVVRNISVTLNITLHPPSPDLVKGALESVLSVVVHKLMGLVAMKLKGFIHAIKPALLQIGKWLVSFGDKIQATIEGFSMSLDLVQKIFDQLMSTMSSGAGEGEEQMLYETWFLFDVSDNNFFTADDLSDVANMYGITALQGSKSSELFKKYDGNSDGKLVKPDYAKLVNDESVPNVMALVLRTWASRLAVISGNVAASRMRDEVAESVVQYLTLTAAQNMTKIGWVSQTLTNRSLPKPFTADVMKQLAQNKDNPNKLVKADVGQLVIGEMVRLNAPYVAEVMRLMVTPEFWASEGFDPADQPRIVEQVTAWITAAPGGAEAMHKVPSLIQKTTGILGHSTPVLIEDMPMRARELVEERMRRHNSKMREAKSFALMQSDSSQCTKYLRHHLLGGAMASAGADDPTMAMAVNKGQKARPETLKFAKYLSSNASATAARFNRMAFDYSKESSNALDSFATKIQAMIKKTQSFLHQMEEYSTETGVERLENMTGHFADVAGDDITRVLMKAVNKKVDALMQKADDAFQKHFSIMELTTEDEEEISMSGIWGEVNMVLTSLQLILPAVVDNLKFARKEVSAVSKQLDTIFGAFQQQGPPIFNEVAALYTTMWTAYYVLFAILTVSVLLYGLWASGWFGGPKATEADEEYVPPETFMDRCLACVSACQSCVRGCQDSGMCFWSVIIIMQVLVLVLFLVSILLCILAGVKAFLAAGCAQIYIVNDSKICTGVLGMIRRWLMSFLLEDPVLLHDACDSHTLLTCQLIGAKLKKSAMYTTVGSMMAAVFSFQMIIESAVLHERATWRKIFDEESKKGA
mmetsp:Transcript_126040/g.245869  ORF Transcript_126040/g.245869 Transcript_126040/m.245869 type:complete len:978 (+) Transcript_126040:119-3052(+)|eukprot:CAMPEP_0172662428 /NCGR_PEP_ID=MMETSP1074-20121228/5355_1 /TAXON_ID=2916 /ORGANISM="Ceratium fusus, Strain PA161109" /LENGTH=977 /DNA_ID=CAMNT_0013478345 /DNA_START=101 /DNA_END=3034 /DNA_ORIENTATION=-